MVVVFVCVLTSEQKKEDRKLEEGVLGRKVVVEVCQYLFRNYENSTGESRALF